MIKKEQIYMNAFKYYNPDEYEQAFEKIENPTFDDALRLEGISKEEFMQTLLNQGLTFDEFLIKVRAVKPEGYDFDKYSEVEITCPGDYKLYTDTDTLCITYKAYQKGEYKFTGNVTSGNYTGTSAEVTVLVTIDLPQLEDDEANPELQSMKLKINVTEDNKTIQLPLYTDTDENYIYDFEVDWGDGNQDTITNSNLDRAIHTYTNIGTYTIIIKGTYESLYVRWDNESIRQALIEIEQWGATGLYGIYLGKCTNLEEIASPTKNSFVNITEFYYSFFRCTALTTLPKDLFMNCPNVIEFNCTFYNCTNLTGKSIHLWEEGRYGINSRNGGFGCYACCEKLDDYEKIPEYWKSEPR